MIAAALGGALILGGWKFWRALSGPETVSYEKLVPRVKTVTVTPGRLYQEVNLPGTLTFFEKASVASKVEGRVASIHADLGDPVVKGGRLAQLETFDVELKMRQAQAAVNSARAQVALADARYQAVQRDADRQIASLERMQSDIIAAKATYINAEQTLKNKKEIYDLGGVSDSQMKSLYTDYVGSMSRYYQSRKDYVMRLVGFRDSDLKAAGIPVPSVPSEKRRAFIDFNTQVDFHQAQAARAQMAGVLNELEGARLYLKETTIVSPLTGVVAQRSLEPGEPAKPGEPIFVIVRMDKLLVSTAVPEKDLQHIRVGQEVKITVDARNSESFQGRVYRTAPVVDVKTRTAEVRIEVPNPEGRLNPGMFARAAIVTRTLEKAMSLPESALANRRQESGKTVADVFIYREGSVFKHPVVVGERYGDTWEITAGVNTGTEVVYTSVDLLKDGSAVKKEAVDAK